MGIWGDTTQPMAAGSGWTLSVPAACQSAVAVQVMVGLCSPKWTTRCCLPLGHPSTAKPGFPSERFIKHCEDLPPILPRKLLWNAVTACWIFKMIKTYLTLKS